MCVVVRDSPVIGQCHFSLASFCKRSLVWSYATPATRSRFTIMHTLYAIVHITNLLAVYRRFGVASIYSFSVVILRTLAVINTKRVMVLLFEFLKAFLNGFEISVYHPNIHGTETATVSKLPSSCSVQLACNIYMHVACAHKGSGIPSGRRSLRFKGHVLPQRRCSRWQELRFGCKGTGRWQQ